MPTLKDEAICIRHWDWSETSQTVSLLTREHGVVRGLAKGAKRENAKFSGGLELATRGELLAIVKQEDHGHSLATLTAWDLLETFPAVRRSLPAFSASMAMLDFVHHGLIERDPHPRVFDALTLALRGLDRPGAEVVTTLLFAWTLIEESGHRPELFEDAERADATRTGPGADALLYGFDPARGALVPDPGESAPLSWLNAAGKTPWRVRGETVRVLRDLATDKPISDAQAHSPAIARAFKLLCFYFRELVGTQPPAIRAMLESLPIGVGA